jgi:general L-amino acid transport system substrate-binding protein
MRNAVRWLPGLALIGGLALGGLFQNALAGTLDAVAARGTLLCGVGGDIPGLSYKDGAGAWSGLDVDFCRAVAAAALGDADKVELVALDNAARLDALREKRIDLLARNTTWTMSRDLDYGMRFVDVLYYDGQGFMVPRKSGLMTALALGGKRVCSLSSSTSLDNARRYFTRNRMALKLKAFDNLADAKAAYLTGKCDAITTDQSQLYALRSTLEDPRSQRILPEVISKEPLSPAVREEDQRWFDLVRWTLFVLIDAEEQGIDSTNVGRAREEARSEDTRRLLDLDGRAAKHLGVAPGWTYRIIKAVGNYAEIFDRNLGESSPLKIKRGLNALWRDGGILYAPPAR